MKKTIVRVLALALVAVTLVCTLASCGKVSGKYSAELDVALASVKVTYDFKMFGKVEMTVKAEALGNVETKTYEGKYEITEDDEGKMTINFEFEDETDDTKTYGGEKELTIDKENDTIKIGLVTYKKVK